MTAASHPGPADDAELVGGFLLRAGLREPGEAVVLTALTGGVSSEIWRVDLPGRSICVKRALARLRVASEWYAPVERSLSEWRWLQLAATVCPANVPVPLALDEASNMFAMAFLEPASHPGWKAELLAGRIDDRFAAEVGSVLAWLHGATAGDEAVARAFANDAMFEALRLEPYLAATARAHPDLSGTLAQLAERTRCGRKALVHGDVSPKNILAGPKGPVFLDAECAWYGDPAFDLAFCLNHLLLKAAFLPQRAAAYLRSYAALSGSYLGAVTWEDRDGLEHRVATLLPALALARVDGKSPVEYLGPDARAAVRRACVDLIAAGGPKLDAVADAWLRAFAPASASRPHASQESSDAHA